MCGRYTLVSSENEVKSVFRLNIISAPLVPVYNACPTMLMPVITNLLPNELQFYRWGLIPHWAKDKSIGSKMINARAETLPTKPAFTFPFHQQRCLVPATGYFEWFFDKGIKTPYLIKCSSDELFAFAGLWAKWYSTPPLPPQTLYSFTIITVPPVNSIAHLHNRMPLILTPQQYQLWLATELNTHTLEQILHTPDVTMDFYPVSQLVNNAANNLPDVISPAT